MKHILHTQLTLFACICMCIVGILNAQQVVIHSWDFNTGNTGIPGNEWPDTIYASTGNGMLVHNFTLTDTALGDPNGYNTPEVPAGLAFKTSGIDNNGNSITLHLPTIGYTNPILTYETKKNSGGFGAHTYYYSIDGNYFTYNGLSSFSATTWTNMTRLFTFMGSGVNNNPNFKIRFSLSGATAADGYALIDNIKLIAHPFLHQNQTDDFQYAIPPALFWDTNTYPDIDTIGPNGNGDWNIKISSDIENATNNKLYISNTSQWAGNYRDANISHISMHMRNDGTSQLSMRLVLNAYYVGYCVSEPITVPVGSGWIPVSFSLTESNMTSIGDTYDNILVYIDEVKILHSTTASDTGTAITAALCIDNITAGATPLPVELSSFTASVNTNGVVLSWTTATETNNHGFEVERKTNGTWRVLGFVAGNGSTSAPHRYNFTDANARGSVVYRLKQVNRDGSFEYSQIVEVFAGQIPKEYTLSQNYPNPFNPATTIVYQLPKSGYVMLKIYDVLGKEIAALVNEAKDAGSYTATFDASQLSSGMYFYRLQSGSFTSMKKMIVTK